MLLKDKVAVVYGAGGSIGGAVARAFAREGARLFLAGRTTARLEPVAAAIAGEGGTAETAEVDTLDERAVDAHADDVAAAAGGIDVVFNAVGHGDVHGLPLTEMPYEDFVRPLEVAMRSQFLTTRAAARHMAPRGAGVIMAITATTSRQSIPHVGGTGVTFDAVESLCRQFACELGPLGIRVVWLLTTGIAEALAEGVEVFPGYGSGVEAMTRDELIAWNAAKTLRGRMTTLEEVGDAATFLASDRAAAITGGALNLTAGAVPTR